MVTFLQDTARNNLISWTAEAVRLGFARGAMLSPFSSPREGNGFKRSAIDTSESIRTAGGEFWFDPMTHALNMPRAGDFRFYDGWPLWSDTRGELVTAEHQRDHIRRVYDIQDGLGSPRLAPTVLVSYPDTPQSQLALILAGEAVTEDGGAWVAIAGDQQFWTSGAELDAHIGALDQLEPGGWLLTVSRSDNAMPPGATSDEIYGLMRSVYALSRDRPVRVAFGDLSALPAIAAGAESLGTGWDMRQRICAYQDFEERLGDAPGGGWYQRPTLAGLLGGLAQGEYRVLQSEDPERARALTPGTIGPRPGQAFMHHASVLAGVISELAPLQDRDRVEALRARYVAAGAEWPEVQRITHTRLGYANWIQPLLAGVDAFMAAEGWV